MKRFIAGAVVVLLPVAAVAQTTPPAKACVFDTAAHSDTLDLVFLVRAYRGQSSRPDPVLTSAFGEMIRPRLVLPPTIHAMFFPYTYLRYHDIRMMVRPFGTLLVSVAGPTDIDMMWDSATKDSATESVLIQDLRTAATAKELQDLADRVGWAALQTVRLKFLAGPDTGVRAALLPMRVPMLVIESPSASRDGSVHFPDGIHEDISTSVQLRFIVDETGHIPSSSIKVVQASDSRFVAEAMKAVNSQKFTPAKSGGCPVRMEVEQAIKFWRGGP